MVTKYNFLVTVPLFLC